MEILKVKNLCFSYDDINNTIDDISFSIEKGSYTTIIGHNGSGKSTIAKLMIGLLEAKSGSIEVDGIILNHSNLYKIRNKIGIVFQNPDNQFIGSTVKDDIAFGLENHCVPQKDMDSIINKYASIVKMDEYLDKEPTKLSGGQKQRVAIAGVLAMNNEIIIFDESTSMLDPQGKDEIKNIIRKLNKENNITVISITHDIEEVSLSDSVIVLNKGKIFMSGNPKDIMIKDKELLSVGLDIPFSKKIVNLLKEKGININDEITLEGLVNNLGDII